MDVWSTMLSPAGPDSLAISGKRSHLFGFP
jgi:hypothetical protein